MKITIIRHAKVDLVWEKRYTAAQYDAACAAYDAAPILPLPAPTLSCAGRTVYTGTLPRTCQTAAQLFSDAPVCKKLALLDEVPLRSFSDTAHAYPRWWWELRGRLQWLMNHPRQPETRTDTLRRAFSLIDFLEAENQDCILVTSGFFMHPLLYCFRRRGYEIKQGGLFFDHLERVLVSGRAAHCGGCSNNCPLCAPLCHIGQEKARREGL